MPRALAAALALLVAASARADSVRRLAATFFGETVGEVRLNYDPGEIAYHSDLLVVRDSVRLRQRGFLEARFDPATGALLQARARRCTQREGSSTPPTCTRERRLGRHREVPALAAELFLARGEPGVEQCLDVVDEESGRTGRACATKTLRDDGRLELTGSKLGAPFRAVLTAAGELLELELAQQGARFLVSDGPVEVSDADLFADAIPSAGDVAGALRRGKLRVRVHASPEALAALRAVDAIGQRLVADEGGSLVVEITRIAPPRTPRSRKVLDHAALLVAQSRGGHLDCQTATEWFVARARARGWKVRPAVGFAFVDGRFAFHAWAVVQTPDGDVPVDPLLAQVPADAGHVQLAASGESAGALLVAFRRGLTLEVE